jgi:putative PIN family toxin of toxin-antitoxin system
VRRVVFDTNVFISAFITPGGRGEAALQKAIGGEVQLFTSVPILTELAGKLQDKFRWDHDRVAAAVRHVASVATVVKPTGRLSVLADEPDNRILECAAAAGAQFIVTGDLHLLDLKTHEGVSVVTLAAFLCAADPNDAPSA